MRELFRMLFKNHYAAKDKAMKELSELNHKRLLIQIEKDLANGYTQFSKLRIRETYGYSPTEADMSRFRSYIIANGINSKFNKN